MFICICNQLREKEIACAIEDGACSAAETFLRLGCSPICGQCVPTIRESVRQKAVPTESN